MKLPKPKPCSNDMQFYRKKNQSFFLAYSLGALIAIIAVFAIIAWYG